jgi:hypothetical protein
MDLKKRLRKLKRASGEKERDPNDVRGLKWPEISEGLKRMESGEVPEPQEMSAEELSPEERETLKFKQAEERREWEKQQSDKAVNAAIFIKKHVKDNPELSERAKDFLFRKIYDEGEEGVWNQKGEFNVIEDGDAIIIETLERYREIEARSTRKGVIKKRDRIIELERIERDPDQEPSRTYYYMDEESK